MFQAPMGSANASTGRTNIDQELGAPTAFVMVTAGNRSRPREKIMTSTIAKTNSGSAISIMVTVPRIRAASPAAGASRGRLR